MAIDKLEAKPKECLYIADGIGQELAGARAEGIQAYMLRVPGENDDDPYREKWSGPVIASLKQVIPLVQ
jgi:putative hydrolase of the HAD superfamily